MAPAFPEWRYVPVEIDSDVCDQVRGVFFSNEFFDALPGEAVLSPFVASSAAGSRHRRKDASCGRKAISPHPKLATYSRRFFPVPAEGNCYEANLEALDWIGRINRALGSSWVLSIDYGYTRAEAVRFARETLLSYRRHTAGEDVLAEPGERDIAAHVNFTALAECGEECDMRTDCFGTLA